MNQNPELSSPVALFQKALRFYREHFQKIVLLAILPVVLGALWRILLAIGLPAPLPLEFLALVLISLLTQLIFIDLVVVGGAGTAKQALHRVRGLFWPFLGVTILAGLAFLGGSLLLFVPGLIVGVWLIFASFIVVAERQRGWRALTESWYYVQDLWWEVFAYLLVWLLGIALAMLVVYGLLSFLVDTILIRNIVSLLVSSLILSPLGVTYIFFLYQEIKVWKKASGKIWSEEEHQRRKRWLIILVVLGVLVVVGLAFLSR